jgi:hypothetical protein
VPSGARLDVARDFVRVPDPDHKAIIFKKAETGVIVALAPLFPGTNDPDALAEMWAKDTHVTRTGSSKIESAGGVRDAVGFAGEINGIALRQVIVLYITPRYRLGVLVSAPAALFETQQFQRDTERFLKTGVVLP